LFAPVKIVLFLASGVLAAAVGNVVQAFDAKGGDFYFNELGSQPLAVHESQIRSLTMTGDGSQVISMCGYTVLVTQVTPPGMLLEIEGEASGSKSIPHEPATVIMDQKGGLRLLTASNVGKYFVVVTESRTLVLHHDVIASVQTSQAELETDADMAGSPDTDPGDFPSLASSLQNTPLITGIKGGAPMESLEPAMAYYAAMAGPPPMMEEETPGEGEGREASKYGEVPNETPGREEEATQEVKGEVNEEEGSAR